MRTVAVEAQRLVAVVAKDAQSFGPSLPFEPRVKAAATAKRSVFATTASNVIYGKELGTVLTATATYFAVLRKNLQFQLPPFGFPLDGNLRAVSSGPIAPPFLQPFVLRTMIAFSVILTRTRFAIAIRCKAFRGIRRLAAVAVFLPWNLLKAHMAFSKVQLLAGSRHGVA
jgi:hypothetical protein